MEISIQGWETKNLRIPDMQVELSDKVNFIQMPNGGGKTTLLTLMRAALSDNWVNLKSIGGDKNGLMDLARKRNPEDIGEFKIKLLIKEVPDRGDISISFEYLLKFESNVVNKYTVDADKGKQGGFNPPRFLSPFLTPSHVDVFLFKGDKVDDHFKGEKAPVEETLDSFSGAIEIDKMIVKLKAEFKTMTDGLVNKQGADTHQKALNQIKIVKASLVQEKKLLEGELKEKNRKLTPLENKVKNTESSNFDFLNERKQLEDKIKIIKGDIYTQEDQLAHALTNPYAFSQTLADITKEFLTELQEAKLPGHAYEFFVDLTNQPKCVCGDDLNKSKKAYILKNAEDYLGEEHTNTVNLMKHECSQNIDLLDIEQINETLKTLKGLESDRARDQARLDQLIKQNEKGALTEEELELYTNLKTETSKIAEKIISLDEQKLKPVALKKVKLKSIDDIESIHDCNALKKHFEDLKAEAHGYKNNLDLLNGFVKALEDAKNLSLKRICSDLTVNVNKRISEMHKDKSFRVKSITNKINIEGSGEGGSGGQNLIAVSAFALSLLDRTGVTYPLLIDHPATALQGSSRTQLSKALTEIDSQILCLVIDTEKESFIEQKRTREFHPFLNNARFITIFRNDDDHQVDIELPKDNSTYKSLNGIVSSNKDFFRDFDIEDQEDK